jgi:hypothetical protein
MRPDAREYCATHHAPQVVFGRYDRLMRASPGFLLLGILLVGAGLVWIAQGLGIDWAPRSFMTADRAWVFIGAVTAVAGGVVIGWSRQQRT